MNEYRVKSFGELHEALGNHRRDAGWMYRGHADPDWALVPRAGRPPFDRGYDEIFFRRWQSESSQFLDESPANDWEWLALAQHNGFATRLLDWTMRPLAAAYFAVAEPGEGDSVIYAFKTSTHASSDDGVTPFQRQGLCQFVPRKVNPRVSRQIGWFTLHGPATLSVQDGLNKGDRLETITIDASYRSELLFELNQYGVNAQSLFPHLVGLSRRSAGVGPGAASGQATYQPDCLTTRRCNRATSA